MKKKIIGILVCMLSIIIALSATSATNVQTTQYVNEYNDLEPNLSTPANSLGFITIKIVAKVSEVHDPYNLLNGKINVNDKITGKYIYDSGIPDSDPDPRHGLYLYTSSTFGMELEAGGFIFKTNPNNVNFGFEILNDIGYDIFFVGSGENLQLSNGMLVDTIIWQLIDTTQTALSSDALLTTAPVLSDWDYNELSIDGYEPSSYNFFGIKANVTKATKSKSRDAYFASQPILNWLLEHFANMFQILRQLMKL